MSTSPQRALLHLLEEFERGDRSAPEFHSGLDHFHAFLEDWSHRLDALPELAGYHQGLHMRTAAQEGLGLFSDAVAAFRDYADGGASECRDEGLHLAEQAQQLLQEVLQSTLHEDARLESESN